MNPFCYTVHGISLEELQKEPYFEQVVPELIDFIGSDIIVAHNSTYEYNTLKREFERASQPAYARERFTCTMALARLLVFPASFAQRARMQGSGPTT